MGQKELYKKNVALISFLMIKEGLVIYRGKLVMRCIYNKHFHKDPNGQSEQLQYSALYHTK